MNPLAIVPVGLYTHRSRLDFATFIERCKDRSEALLDRLVTTDYITALGGHGMVQDVARLRLSQAAQNE